MYCDKRISIIYIVHIFAPHGAFAGVDLFDAALVSFGTPYTQLKIIHSADHSSFSVGNGGWPDRSAIH